MGSFSIFIALIIFVCFLLVLVVMVQNPKGGGLSSSFGGGGQQWEVSKRLLTFWTEAHGCLLDFYWCYLTIQYFTGNQQWNSDSRLLEDNTLSSLSLK